VGSLPTLSLRSMAVLQTFFIFLACGFWKSPPSTRANVTSLWNRGRRDDVPLHALLGIHPFQCPAVAFRVFCAAHLPAITEPIVLR